MVNRYWRKIESIENDIENSMQISSILLKLKGYDEKLSDLSKIGNKENNISSNLGIINTNKSNISSNLEKISNNKTNISSNVEIINTNKSDISSNLEKTSNNKTNISSNLGKINDNENSISSNLSKINDNENSISNNLEKIDNFTQYILKSAKDFEQTYTIERQIFRFNKNTHFTRFLKKKLNLTLLKIVYYL